MPIPLPLSMAKVEALACRRAVQFATEIGLRDVVFDGNSIVVIQAIIEGLGFTYGNIIEDILYQALVFHFSDFCHFKHNCNIVADVLAKKTKDYIGLQIWLEDLLEDIAPLVLFDVH
ncbi:hypothetical protein SO802_018769 [Lithocarpus litseifolius]|uniref:RNase H type-1 domain-containing protein n=1 Tax=Lithocarpus litseifolius TaxID=425828 RepID=A0AAW2CLQ7_9ROSI